MSLDNSEMRVRHIVVKIILNEKIFPGAFLNDEEANVKIIRANSDNDTLTVDAKINKISGWQQSDCVVTISGMLIEDINAIIKINPYTLNYQNFVSKIEVYAGYDLDKNKYPPLVYKGDIYEASPDFNAASRSRPLTIKSINGWGLTGLMADNTSIKNQISLIDLFKLLASKFEDHSVTILGADGYQVENVLFSGSALQQMQQACAAYGFQFHNDDETLLISPIGKPMREQVLTITSDDNLLGYPMPQTLGVAIRVRFNPAIQFGQKINLVTSMEGYEGLWWVNGLSHHLTNRDRDWTSTLQLNRNSITEGA